MDDTGCPQQLELFEVNQQQVTVTFDGEQLVSDAGLLPIRQLDQELGILAEAAWRLPAAILRSAQRSGDETPANRVSPANDLCR